MKRDRIDDGQNKTALHRLLEFCKTDFEKKKQAASDKKSKIDPYQGQVTQLSNYHTQITELAKTHQVLSLYRQSTLELFNMIANDPKVAVLKYYRLGEFDSRNWPNNVQNTILNLYKKTILIAKVVLKAKVLTQGNQALNQFHQQHDLPMNYFHQTEDRELGLDTITAKPPALPESLFFPQQETPTSPAISFFAKPTSHSLSLQEIVELPPSPLSFVADAADPAFVVATTQATQGASRNWLDDIDWATLL